MHLNEPAGGSCCDAGLGLVWHCYCIYITFVCLIQKKMIYIELLRGRGCVESKNMTSAKGKSAQSLNPSIIKLAHSRADLLFLFTHCSVKKTSTRWQKKGLIAKRNTSPAFE